MDRPGLYLVKNTLNGYECFPVPKGIVHWVQLFGYGTDKGIGLLSDGSNTSRVVGGGQSHHNPAYTVSLVTIHFVQLLLA